LWIELGPAAQRVSLLGVAGLCHLPRLAPPNGGDAFQSIRLYTTLPPAFYQALKAHNETAQTPIWLIQEIWLLDEAENLYEPLIESDFQREIRYTIDMLHGRADIPTGGTSLWNLYADVSRWVIALRSAARWKRA